jgi:hypothetical protein
MKLSIVMIGTLAASVLMAAAPAFAADSAQGSSATASKNSGLMKDFDTLGGNDVLLDKARQLNPDQRISVVQDRIVQRRNRFEIAPEFASVLGGDPYNHTNGFAFNAYFHINPHWLLARSTSTTPIRFARKVRL